MDGDDIGTRHEERRVVHRHVDQIRREATEKPAVSEIVPELALRRVVYRELEVRRQRSKIRQFVRWSSENIVVRH